jgi:lipopolysaccharide export LptBFGC system permease protein LptF
MEIIFVGTIMVVFIVFALGPALYPKAEKKEKKAEKSKAQDGGIILGNGKIVHDGEVINLKEARRRGLKLEFEKKKTNERKPMAWR